MSLENLQLTQINGENICEISICSDNRNLEIPPWQKKVFDKFGSKINQLFFPFSKGLSHGWSLDWIMNEIKDRKDIDYLIFFENDSIPLRKDYLNVIYDKIKDKETIFGVSQNSNHKLGTDGKTLVHPYPATPFSFSIELYNKLERPTFDHHIPRSDTYEELAYKCEEMGYNVCMVWPRSVRGLTESEAKELNCPTLKSHIIQNVYGGYGTQAGSLFFHMYFSPIHNHAELFIERCKQVLNEN